MTSRVPALDLTNDVVELTRALVDIESVSHHEGPIADAVEAALRALPHLEVERFADTIVARTNLGRPERVVIAGHLDTVPLNENLPSTQDDEFLHGLGTCDMKGGDAVMLRLAATVPEPVRDITYVFYEGEEVEAIHNGLGKLAVRDPEALAADFAILMEPTDGIIEGGCQGTLRVEVRTSGVRAHSARAWNGVNAIHLAAPILATLNEYEPRRPVIDGLEYREGLNAVFISGGVAGNVVPDECVVTVNFRFPPDRTEDEALAHLRDTVFAGYDVRVVDSSPGALPGLDRAPAKAFVDAVTSVLRREGPLVKPKFGWTDVARFSVLGVPAVNFGPGDPMFAHKQDEHVPIAQLVECERVLRDWLTDER